MRSRTGQASTEYVAVLALVAIVIATAASLVAAPDLGGAVVHALRTGLCIVGGDICRSVDAEAAGLDPCDTASETHERETGATIVLVRVGDHDEYAITAHSDGSYTVAAAAGGDVSLSTGVGVQLGPTIARVGAGGSVGFGWRSGRGWEVPSKAALDALLARVGSRYELANRHGGAEAALPQETFSYHEGRAGLDASIGLDIGDEDRSTTILEQRAHAEAMLGWRKGPDGRTIYYRLGGELSGALGTVFAQLDRSAQVLVEVHEGRPGTVTLRTADASGGRIHQTAVTLPTARADDRRAARDLVTLGLRPGAASDLATRVRARGRIERTTYVERTDEDGWSVEAKLGIAMGADHTTTATRRRLVDAEVTIGGRTARRIDCLGLDRS